MAFTKIKPETIFSVRSFSEKETRRLGASIADFLVAGNVILLNGNLGSGKTVFTQGLAKGLDVPEKYYVTSPTYTLINQYPGRLPLYHVDLYRIEGRLDSVDLELDEILYGEGVCVIEWPDRLITDRMPEYISIHINVITDRIRELDCHAFGENVAVRLKTFRSNVVSRRSL